MGIFDRLRTKKNDSEKVEELAKLKKSPEFLNKTNPKTRATVSKPLAQEESIFYGHRIRRLYFRDHWYFFLEDILLVAGILNWQKKLDELEDNQEYQKNKAKYILKFKALIGEEADEAVQEKNCLDVKGFLWLLPLVRSEEHVFPGPFPEWLIKTSKLPLLLPKKKQTN